MQNSVGRLWLMANPTSTLKSQWPYYIEPAEQAPRSTPSSTPPIQTRMAETAAASTPNPSPCSTPPAAPATSWPKPTRAQRHLSGTRLPPARHPRLILEKNLYGLDIDDRAAQLAGFALLMKARADDRRLFNDPPWLNVLSLQESKGWTWTNSPLTSRRSACSAHRQGIARQFEHAKTFGSLIQIPDALNAQPPTLTEAWGRRMRLGICLQAAAQDLMALVSRRRCWGESSMRWWLIRRIRAERG